MCQLVTPIEGVEKYFFCETQESTIADGSKWEVTLAEEIVSMPENRYYVKRLQVGMRHFTSKMCFYDNNNPTTKLLIENEIALFKKFVSAFPS